MPAKRKLSFIELDNSIKDSCEKWGKLVWYNKLKFGLYAYHHKNAIKVLNSNAIFDKYFSFRNLDLYAINAKMVSDTLDIEYNFYYDTVNFYTYYSLYASFPMGFKIYNDTIRELKEANYRKTVKTNDYTLTLHHDFFKDTSKAYKYFKFYYDDLNEWLFNECKSKGIFENNY